MPLGDCWSVSLPVCAEQGVCELGDTRTVQECCAKTGAMGISLVVQWLRICLLMQGTPIQPPVRDLTVHMLQTTESTHHSYSALAPQPKILQDATETQGGQIKKYFTYIYPHLYAHTYTHIGIYTYTHTHMYTYTYT